MAMFNKLTNTANIKEVYSTMQQDKKVVDILSTFPSQCHTLLATVSMKDESISAIIIYLSQQKLLNTTQEWEKASCCTFDHMTNK
jgi:hypothetical protein